MAEKQTSDVADIERRTLDGREARVAYLDDNFRTVSRDEATLVKVSWDDGETAWLTPEDSDEEESDEGLFDDDDEESERD